MRTEFLFMRKEIQKLDETSKKKSLHLRAVPITISETASSIIDPKSRNLSKGSNLAGQDISEANFSLGLSTTITVSGESSTVEQRAEDESQAGPSYSCPSCEARSSALLQMMGDVAEVYADTPQDRPESVVASFSPKETDHKPLKILEPTEEYNILLLGPTGVGKSAFINAFVNYLAFDSLNDALSDPGPLQYLIPGSFLYNNNEGIHCVSFGEENDSQSCSARFETATENTMIYTVRHGRSNKVIRFIDTPGICDTRGIDQDYKNVKDILTTLESIEGLSTILFLLPSDKVLLRLSENFCVTELLCHLHRDACKNLIFGFTKAVATDFMLGGIYTTLQRLLERLDVNIKLGNHNLFCFDSGCFRFLAAYKQLGVFMSDKEEYEWMWAKSAKAANGLIEQTVRLPMHQVSKMLSLHKVREHLLLLTGLRTAIKMTEANWEVKDELSMIRDAQAQFSVYLNREAICAYNLTTSGYLDAQIHMARMRDMPADANRLKKQKIVHERQVQDMMEAINNNEVGAPDEAALGRTIEELCKMPILGNCLGKEVPQQQSLRSIDRWPHAFELTKPGNGFSWFWNSEARSKNITGMRPSTDSD
jgi:GTPase SAR1 family protein